MSEEEKSSTDNEPERRIESEEFKKSVEQRPDALRMEREESWPDPPPQASKEEKDNDS